MHTKLRGYQMIKRHKFTILTSMATLLFLFMLSLSLWIIVPQFRAATKEYMRRNDYDAFLQSEFKMMLSKGTGYSGLQSGLPSKDCTYLAISQIEPRSGNYLYREWDYICVVAVDGRYLFSYRPWDSYLLYPFFAQEDGGGIVDPTYDPELMRIELARINPCIDIHRIRDGSELQISIFKAKTPLGGLLRRIEIGHGWNNVSGYDLVVGATVPVVDIIATEDTSE